MLRSLKVADMMLEGEPMAGVIGIEQIAREGEQAAPVLRLPIRADRGEPGPTKPREAALRQVSGT